MVEDVYRKRSGSVTMKQSSDKSKSEEIAAADDVTKGPIGDDVVGKIAGGKSIRGKSSAKRSQSKGEDQIISREVLGETERSDSCEVKITEEKGSDSCEVKITEEKGSTKTKSVMNNEEDCSSPLKRKRGADGEIVLAYFSSQERSSPRLRPRQVPTFRIVDLSENDNKRIVDKRVKVYWPESRKWFTGLIKAFDDNKRLHTVLYDDGDKEELDLRKERFELEILPAEGFNLRADSISRKKVKRLDGNEVRIPLLPDATFELGDAKEVIKSPETNVNAKEVVKIPETNVDATEVVKSPELKMKDASKKVGRRGISKLQRKSTRIKQDLAANMEKMDASEDVDIQHVDEAKKSLPGGDINVKEVVEVKHQIDTDKTEALEEVDDENGGSSDKAQATAIDVPADGKKKINGDMEEKQAKTGNLTVSEDAAISSILTSPAMKGNMEDQSPKLEVTDPGEKVEEGVISKELAVPLACHTDTVKNHNARKPVSKAAYEVSVDL